MIVFALQTSDQQLLSVARENQTRHGLRRQRNNLSLGARCCFPNSNFTLVIGTTILERKLDDRASNQSSVRRERDGGHPALELFYFENFRSRAAVPKSDLACVPCCDELSIRREGDRRGRLMRKKTRQ